MSFTKQFILEAIVENINTLFKMGKQGKTIEKGYDGGYITVDHDKYRQNDIANLQNGFNKVSKDKLKSSDKCFTDVTIAVRDKYFKMHPKSRKTDDDIVCELLNKFPSK